MTSSKINTAPYFSVIFLKVSRKPASGRITPIFPAIGSTITAAILSPFDKNILSTDSIIQAAHYNNREEKILAMQKRYDQYIDKKGFKRKKALDLLVDEFRPWKKNTIIKYLKISSFRDKFFFKSCILLPSNVI